MYPSALLRGHWHSYLYDRLPCAPLGDEENGLPSSVGQDLRLCFNCGSPDHAVASCPAPIDRQLVSLSRQLFNFLNRSGELTRQVNTRFCVAEGWKQQRLEWLRLYEPGAIRGALLRDALGLQEGDPGNTVEWLRNMAYWGYPPGWVGCHDPRQLISSWILEDGAEGLVAAARWDSFTIFDDADDDEKVDLRLFGLRGSSTPSGAANSLTAFVGMEPTRWATYPSTYFSSTALSVYNGAPLDRVVLPPLRAGTTFTPERRALWEHIVSGGLAAYNALSVPPWRAPDAFGGPSYSAVDVTVEEFLPVPPSTAPPPFPPKLGSPVRALTPQKCLILDREPMPHLKLAGITDVADGRSVVDMVISDDSE